MKIILRMLLAFNLQTKENDMGDSIVSNTKREPTTVPEYLLHLAVHRFQYREQDLPGHRERFETTRQLIGLVKWHKFDEASAVRSFEASRSTFSPAVFSLVLVVLGVAGAIFIEMLTAKIKL